MSHIDIANEIRDAKERIVLMYAFNATGKTKLSVAYKDATKSEDANAAANIINTLSHKKGYYFEGDELTPDSKKLFDSVFTKIKSKYNFVLHAPAPAAIS